jgi:hypothetical protein
VVAAKIRDLERAVADRDGRIRSLEAEIDELRHPRVACKRRRLEEEEPTTSGLDVNGNSMAACKTDSGFAEDKSDDEEKSDGEEKSDVEEKSDGEENSDGEEKSDEDEKCDEEDDSNEDDKSDEEDESDEDDKSDDDCSSDEITR